MGGAKYTKRMIWRGTTGYLSGESRKSTWARIDGSMDKREGGEQGIVEGVRHGEQRRVPQ